MKYALFLLFTFCVQLVLAAPFNGYVTKRGSAYYFTPKSSKILYKITTLYPEVKDNLSRLEKGDMIAGEGSLDTTNKKITMNSIDYVGLRRLLGPWKSYEGSVIFKDFSTLRFVPYDRNLRAGSQFSKYLKEFRYSLSPSDGTEWALFMSDDRSTTFATMELTNTKVIMKIFESESGKIVRTLKLERP